MAVDKKGRTPLFCACAEKRDECVRYYCESAHEHLRLIDLADHRGDTNLKTINLTFGSLSPILYVKEDLNFGRFFDFILSWS